MFDFIKLCFGFSQSVSRRTYLLVGLGLALLKYGIDALLVWVFTSHLWTPLSYLTPLASARYGTLSEFSQATGAMAAGETATILMIVMAIYALPFAWVGLSMSVRRAADAGMSPWWGVLFLVPGINWLLILVLCCRDTHSHWEVDRSHRAILSIKLALLAIALGVAQTLGMVLLSVHVLGQYGSALFLSSPLITGLMAGYLVNMRTSASTHATLMTAATAVLISALAILLFALEGVICIAMAVPIALMAAFAGAHIGRAIATHMRSKLSDDQSPRTPSHIALIMLIGPLLCGAEAVQQDTEAPLYKVATSIEIDAPPERVWHEVIHFSELPPIHPLIARTGIAYPIRARLVGQGVGAVRHCEFSTGAFVEPITVWEPGKRLAFDVESQPLPMEEWSPYRAVHPPHLDGYWRSKRGEFRFITLPSGGTRLEGSTWYELDMTPSLYWRVLANGLVHGIHTRVLSHVKQQAET